MRPVKPTLLIVLICGITTETLLFTARADLPIVAGIFDDNMVLQSGTKVPVWGWAEPSETVRIQFMDQVKTATVNDNGRWTAWLDPLPVSTEGRVLRVSLPDSRITREFSNVVVGEVWFCSGQSNANMNVYKTYHAASEIALSRNPNLRWFTIRNNPNPSGPDREAEGDWVSSSPETAWEFSAYGYFFAKALQHSLNVPVGVIQGSMGGTPVEAWISLESLQASPAGKELLGFWEGQMDGFSYAESPNESLSSLLKLGFPAGYFNGRVAPGIPYAIKGAIWYQGESNRFRAEQYAHLFPLMIQDWRRHWKQGDFPFYYVQLANIGEETNRDSEWPLLQFVQTQSLKVHNTGMAVANDSLHVNLHPRDKQQVGRRLALWALAKTYHKNVPYSGPIYKSMSVEGNRIRIYFDHAEEGLFIRGNPQIYHPSVTRKAPLVLTGFEIRGEDTEFFEAEARIDGQTVVVSHTNIAEPVAARYAWTSNAASANLTNRSGLPASLFTTSSDRPPIYYNQNPFKRN